MQLVLQSSLDIASAAHDTSLYYKILNNGITSKIGLQSNVRNAERAPRLIDPVSYSLHISVACPSSYNVPQDVSISRASPNTRKSASSKSSSTAMFSCPTS